MTSGSGLRRLEPAGQYHGPLWGDLPPAYPTEQAERVYRYLLEVMRGDSVERTLMGNGFQGVAYRFRAAIEYGGEFEALLGAPGGAAPPVDTVFRQERALYGFFVTGLSCLESFSFALNALGAYYKPAARPDEFAVSHDRLRHVGLPSVAASLHRCWPGALISEQTTKLIKDDTFRVWNRIRNVLSHRVVPPRTIYLGDGSPPRAAWRLIEYHALDRDEPLELVIQPRRRWLEEWVRDLWNGVEQSFPPP